MRCHSIRRDIEQILDLGNPGIVHKNMDWSIFAPGLINQSVDGLTLGHISLKTYGRRSVCLTDLGSDRRCATLADVSHNDLRALLSKELSGRLAQARPGTGYQRGFS